MLNDRLLYTRPVTKMAEVCRLKLAGSSHPRTAVT